MKKQTGCSRLARNYKRMLGQLCFISSLFVGLSVPAAADAYGISYDVIGQGCVTTATSTVGGSCVTTEAIQSLLVPVTVPAQTGSTSTGYAGGQTAFGTANGYIAFGLIRGYGNATASGDQFQGGFSSAEGSFEGSWQDTLTVTSSSLPLGAPVSLLITLNVDAALAGSSGGTVFLTSTLQLGNDAISFSTSSVSSNFKFFQTLIVNTSVGAVLPASGSMYGPAVARDFPGSEFATVDASNTALFNIDVLTQGATYTTASGYAYFSSTPEPSSLILLGTGVLGAIGARRVKRTSATKLG